MGVCNREDEESMDLLKRMMIVRVTEEMYGEVQRETRRRGMRLSQLVRIILAKWLQGDKDIEKECVDE